MASWRMQPTASILGVIAIVSVMISATATGTENGAIERGIDHQASGEEDRRFAEEERTTNLTWRAAQEEPEASGNGTESETRPSRQQKATSSAPDLLELQRDQSDLRPAIEDLAEPLASKHTVLESEGPQETTVAAPRPEIAQSSTSSPSERVQTISKRIQEEVRGNEVLPEEEPRRAEPWNATSMESTTSATTELAERKNSEDIRAISFQVPSMGVEAQEGQRDGREDVKLEEAMKPSETRKEHSRPLNNLLAGKSTKAFYEIKPSIKTEMERSHEAPAATSTQRSIAGRRFILPSVDSAFGKFGPYFEDGDQEVNITARIGSNVLLDCKIGMLGDKKVTWLQQSKDSFRLLTVGRTPYSVDQRISLNFRYPSNWRLQILYASPRDSGLYKCQVATHPPLVKKINVIVTAPELTITDDSGRIVPKERHLKAGSALKLRCEARDVLETLEETVVWTRGDETLTEDVSENRTMEISSGQELLVIVSTLVVERASPRHAGNYSCVVPGKAKTTIAVHVLNGELPAAVHDGNGVSRAFLNLWLIHLTMSYVFSR